MLSPRRVRFLASWAGPYSGFVLGGIFGLSIFFAPDHTIGRLLFQIAFITYLISFLQLNPLLKYDGYFILMDWLEIPRLRERSIEFVRKDLWAKLITRHSFSREEKLFAVFGVLSLAYTVFMLVTLLIGWGERFRGMIRI